MEQFITDNWSWITFVALWTLPWKGVALWKAAHRREKKWFVALLIINTLALLEIYYIFIWTKRKGASSDPRFTSI